MLVEDRDAARAFFERDRPWWAWALCSLGSADWPYARLWLDAPSGAAIWAFDHPRWGRAIHTFGHGPALEGLIATARLPRSAYLRTWPEAHGALGARYRLDRLEPIVRMQITPALFRPPTDAPPAVVLGPSDGPELARLYAGWPETRFHVGRLRQGYRYLGVREDGQLVAVAENVLRSREEQLAIVQGVYVEPGRRGHGLARAVTAAMTARLFAEGARDVVLDVRANNAAGLGAYARLGYRRHRDFLGGRVEPLR
jgi:ribosomal protein S18 acetylase RimI-like enzyme